MHLIRKKYMDANEHERLSIIVGMHTLK